MRLKGIQVDLSNQKPSSDAESDEEVGEEDDSVKSSLCCLQGCIAASSVGFSFFVALPTGILLIVYSQKDSDYRLLSVGIVLVILPVVVLLIVIALCFNKHRLKRFGRNKIKHGGAITITADNGIEETNYGKY